MGFILEIILNVGRGRWSTAQQHGPTVVSQNFDLCTLKAGLNRRCRVLQSAYGRACGVVVLGQGGGCNI